MSHDDTIESSRAKDNKALSQDAENQNKSATVVVASSSRGVDVEDEFETGQVRRVDEKYYSKVSVYLMMLFSGLAIGSDG